jgi:hypothetical protein
MSDSTSFFWAALEQYAALMPTGKVLGNEVSVAQNQGFFAF